MTPYADARKKVALGKSSKVGRSDILDTPFVYLAGGDVAGLD